MYFSGQTRASLRKEWYVLKAIILEVCLPLLTYDATKRVLKLPERRAYLPLVSTIYDPNKYPTNHVPDHKWECLHTNRARQH